MIKKNFFKKIITSFRHKKDITISLNNFYFYKNKKKIKYLIKINLIRRKKLFFKTKHVSINFKLIKYYNLIIKSFFFLNKPYKKFFNATTIHNINYIVYTIGFRSSKSFIYTEGLQSLKIENKINNVELNDNVYIISNYSDSLNKLLVHTYHSIVNNEFSIILPIVNLSY